METISETKTLKTPSGEHTIIVKSYLTGEDRRAARRVILKMYDDGKNGKVEGVEEVENDAITRVVLEVDGSSENVVERVLKFRADDYDFIIDTVNQISEGMDKKKEKKSGTSTKTSSEEEKQG